jgi:predicted phosphodiesterase
MNANPQEDNASCSTGRLVSRRSVLKVSAAALAHLALAPLGCTLQTAARRKPRTARFGIVTDCHYADVDAAGSRFYRHSLSKLAECVDLMNSEKVDFLIELGDFKDQDDPPLERNTLSYLKAIEKVFRAFEGPTYHVLGNHDMDSISKAQFLGSVENTGIPSSRGYYSFDFNGLHFVVLDANYSSDGSDYDHGNFDWTDANISGRELSWLSLDLAGASGPTVVFVHQRLDGSGPVYVKNAESVRRVLEQSRKVLGVFQGHHHEGGYGLINGIHYHTLRALVEGAGPENNSYAVVEVLPDRTIAVTGYRRAITRNLVYVGSAITG